MKWKILISLLLISFVVQAQMGSTLRRDRETHCPGDSCVAQPGLLDTFPNAEWAHSIRLLDKDYTGPCMTVRGETTNEVDTIWFQCGYIDTCRINEIAYESTTTQNIFIDVWFDQSGNGKDLTPAGVQNNEPYVFYDGELVTNPDGKFAPKYLGLYADSFFFENNTTVVFAGQNNDSTQFGYLYSNCLNSPGSTNNVSAISNNNASSIILQSDTLNNQFNFRTFDLVVPDIYESHIWFLDYQSTTTMYWNDGTSANGSMYLDVWTCVGPKGGDIEYHLYESIGWKIDHSSNRGSIQDNINNYYGIY